jgi:methionine aminopeptidase
MSEIIEKFPALCFSLRAFEDEITAKLGVSECQKHDLLVPYPVLTEKPGTIVAQFKITVLILQGQTTAITGLPIDEA